MEVAEMCETWSRNFDEISNDNKQIQKKRIPSIFLQ